MVGCRRHGKPRHRFPKNKTTPLSPCTRMMNHPVAPRPGQELAGPPCATTPHCSSTFRVLRTRGRVRAAPRRVPHRREGCSTVPRARHCSMPNSPPDVAGCSTPTPRTVAAPAARWPIRGPSIAGVLPALRNTSNPRTTPFAPPTSRRARLVRCGTQCSAAVATASGWHGAPAAVLTKCAQSREKCPSCNFPLRPGRSTSRVQRERFLLQLYLEAIPVQEYEKWRLEGVPEDLCMGRQRACCQTASARGAKLSRQTRLPHRTLDGIQCHFQRAHS